MSLIKAFILVFLSLDPVYNDKISNINREF